MLKITDTTFSLEELAGRAKFNSETISRISKADYVIIPKDTRTNTKLVFFGEVLVFKKLYSSKANIELAANTEDIAFIEFRDSSLWLPTIYFILRDIALPTLLGLLSSYIYDRIKGTPPNETIVHFRAIVTDKKHRKTKQIDYDGPADQFETNFKKIDLNKLFRE